MTPERIVAEARSWIGTPYRHQASLKHVGCDCLGLVLGVWKALYGAPPEQPPPYAPDWAEAGQNEPLIEAALRHLTPRTDGEITPGEILIFRWRAHVAAKHLAIATEAGRMIHAHDGAEVAEVAITPFWRRKIAGRFAFPDVN